MRGRNAVRALDKVAEVLAIKRSAAEMRVSAAATAQRRLESRREEDREDLRRDQQQWSDAVSGPSLSLPMARAWSGAILQGEAALRRLDVEVRDAEDETRRRRGDWCDARARAETAEDLALSASRRVKRLREEAALSEVADRIAQRSAAR